MCNTRKNRKRKETTVTDNKLKKQTLRQAKNVLRKLTYQNVKGPTLLLTPLLTNPLNSSTKLQ